MLHNSKISGSKIGLAQNLNKKTQNLNDKSVYRGSIAPISMMSTSKMTQRFIRPVRKRFEGFTLIELLVVIAIIAILAAVLLPVLHQAQLRGETAACIDHQKQLGEAFVMYSSDNADFIVGNYWNDEQNWPQYKGKYTKTGITPPENWISGWEDPSGTAGNGKITGVIGMTEESDNTNWDLLVDPGYASLGDYTKNPGIFLCPSAVVKVQAYGSGGSATGTPKNAFEVRSVSMNAWVGYVCNPPDQGTGTSAYKVFNKMSAVSAGIGPADLIVFMEERAESIDDGSFAIYENHPGQVFNWPTDYHNEAATIAFADGHVEVHRWRGTGQTANGWGTTAPQQGVVSAKWSGATVTSLADPQWMSAHATILQ